MQLAQVYAKQSPVEVVLDKVQKCTSSELGLRDEYVRDQVGMIPRRSLIRY